MSSKEETEQNEFTKVVETIKKTEEEAERMRLATSDERERIITKAKEKAAKMLIYANEVAVKEKDKIINKGKTNLNQKIKLLLKRAEIEAKQFRKTVKMSDKDVLMVFFHLLNR